MRALMLCAAALLAASAGLAEAESAKGRWHPVQNIPGCVTWNAHPQSDETVTWSGTCNAGKAEGHGTEIWRYREDGKAMEEQITGTLVAGKFAGRRVVRLANGNRFEGDPNGRGVFVFANGGRYEGEFRDDMFTGHGIRTWRDGTRFEGRFLDGEPAGAGTCTKDGRTGRCLIENNEIRWLD